MNRVTVHGLDQWILAGGYVGRCEPVSVGFFQFRVIPFGLCNAPATFERLRDRILSGLRSARCLVYLGDVISFGTDTLEALDRLFELLVISPLIRTVACGVAVLFRPPRCSS